MVTLIENLYRSPSKGWKQGMCGENIWVQEQSSRFHNSTLWELLGKDGDRFHEKTKFEENRPIVTTGVFSSPNITLNIFTHISKPQGPIPFLYKVSPCGIFFSSNFSGVTSEKYIPLNGRRSLEFWSRCPYGPP